MAIDLKFEAESEEHSQVQSFQITLFSTPLATADLRWVENGERRFLQQKFITAIDSGGGRHFEWLPIPSRLSSDELEYRGIE